MSIFNSQTQTYREIDDNNGHEEHESTKQDANVKVKRCERLVKDDVIQLKLTECHDYDVQKQRVTELENRLKTHSQRD